MRSPTRPHVNYALSARADKSASRRLPAPGLPRCALRHRLTYVQYHRRAALSSLLWHLGGPPRLPGCTSAGQHSRPRCCTRAGRPHAAPCGRMRRRADAHPPGWSARRRRCAAPHTAPWSRRRRGFRTLCRQSSGAAPSRWCWPTCTCRTGRTASPSCARCAAAGPTWPSASSPARPRTWRGCTAPPYPRCCSSPCRSRPTRWPSCCAGCVRTGNATARAGRLSMPRPALGLWLRRHDLAQQGRPPLAKQPALLG